MADQQLVRVLRPKAVLFAFHGTISPADWEDKCIYPYIRSNLLSYLKSQWTIDRDIRPLLDKLYQQSFDEHFVFDTMETPLIIAFDSANSNWETVLASVNEYVLWDLAKIRSSASSIFLVKKCWMQGYQEQAIKTLLFEDVLPAIRRFRSMDIKICIFTTMSKEITRLVLSSTTAGNVAQEVDHFFDQETVGPPREASSYDKLASILNVAKSDILFICDYGQDLRTAVDSGLEGVIIVRPGNRPNREYYLTRFPNTSNFELIQFVDPAPATVAPAGLSAPEDPGQA